jgi:hypothetical protein
MLRHKNISFMMKVYSKFIKVDDTKGIENLSKIVPNFINKIY